MERSSGSTSSGGGGSTNGNGSGSGVGGGAGGTGRGGLGGCGQGAGALPGQTHAAPQTLCHCSFLARLQPSVANGLAQWLVELRGLAQVPSRAGE